MIYLLDTHYMIWAISDTRRLSKQLKETLTNRENTIVVSTVSFWEISLKNSYGKLQISGFSPEDLPNFCEKMRFDIKSLSAKESSTYHQLRATYHKDPFDRMLIWQSICNDFIFVSVDRYVRKYTSEGLKLFEEL